MKKMSWHVNSAVVLAALTLGVAPGYAGLLAKSPVLTPGGYPSWFQDQTGLAVQGCLNDPPRLPNLCLLPDGVIEQPGFLPGAPKVFPDNFPIEHFYFVATTAPILLTGGGRASVEFAVEAAFNPEEIANPNQEMFHRLRVLMNPATPAGTYTIVHPWGTTAITPARQQIPFGAGADGRATLDVNVGSALGNLASANDNFQGVLGSDPLFAVSNYLTQTTPVPPAGFLGDCLIESPVTGGVGGVNTVQILDPSGTVIGQTDLFVVCGQKTGLEIIPADADFGTWLPNASSPATTFTITNLTGAAIPARDPAAVPPQGLILTPSTPEFAIQPGDTCAAGLTTLAPGNTCTFDVVFTPVASGVVSGNISIASGAGNPTATVPVTGVGDGVAPVIAITGIQRFTNLATQTISGTLSENGAVQVSVDGAAPVAAEVTGTTWSFNVPALAPNAAHTIQVTANDVAQPAPGNLAAPVTDSITVDTIAPAVIVTEPAAGALTQATTPLTFTATDTNAATTVVKVDGVTVTPAPATLGPLTDGAHAVAVESTDAAGNVTTVTNNFTADGTGPAINIVSPAVKLATPNATAGTIGITSPVLTFPVTDANPDPTLTTVTLDGVPLVNPVSGTTTLGPFIVGEPHVLVVSATDLVGNVSTSTKNFTLLLADGAMTSLGASAPTPGDALLALRVAVQLDTTSAPAGSDTFKHGDVAPLVNGVPQPDGVIDVGDALLILRKAVGLVSF